MVDKKYYNQFSILTGLFRQYQSIKGYNMNIRTNQPTVDASSTTSLLPSSDATTYFSDKNEFPNYLNTLISRGNFAATIGFLEVYF